MGKPLRLSVKVIIKDKEDQCLILRRSMESRGNPGKWDFPGGKVEFGENFDQTLYREVKEETGLSIKVRDVLGTAMSNTPKAKYVYIIMEAVVKSGRVQLSSEHDAYQWIDRTDLPEAGLAEHFKPFAFAYGTREKENASK